MIRKATEADLESIEEIKSLSDLHYDLDFENSEYFVILVDDKIIGYSGYTSYSNVESVRPGYPTNLNKDFAMNLGIAVHPDYRRKGYAKAMKEYVLNIIKERFKGVYVFVKHDNTASINLQLSLGFEKEGTEFTSKLGNHVVVFQKKF